MENIIKSVSYYQKLIKELKPFYIFLSLIHLNVGGRRLAGSVGRTGDF